MTAHRRQRAANVNSNSTWCRLDLGHDCGGRIGVSCDRDDAGSISKLAVAATPCHQNAGSVVFVGHMVFADRHGCRLDLGDCIFGIGHLCHRRSRRLFFHRVIHHAGIWRHFAAAGLATVGRDVCNQRAADDRFASGDVDRGAAPHSNDPGQCPKPPITRHNANCFVSSTDLRGPSRL